MSYPRKKAEAFDTTTKELVGRLVQLAASARQRAEVPPIFPIRCSAVEARRIRMDVYSYLNSCAASQNETLTALASAFRAEWEILVRPGGTADGMAEGLYFRPHDRKPGSSALRSAVAELGMLLVADFEADVMEGTELAPEEEDNLLSAALTISDEAQAELETMAEAEAEARRAHKEEVHKAAIAALLAPPSEPLI